MATELQELTALVTKQAEGLNTLTKSFGDFRNQLAKTPAGGPSPSDVFGVPWARHGEDSMGSRGFSFMKMIGLLTGGTVPEEAKIELDVHDRLNKVYCKEMSDGYHYAGVGQPGTRTFLAPLSTSFMQEKIVPHSFRKEMRQLVAAGLDGVDYDEMGWIRRKQNTTSCKAMVS